MGDQFLTFCPTELSNPTLKKKKKKKKKRSTTTIIGKMVDGYFSFNTTSYKVIDHKYKISGVIDPHLHFCFNNLVPSSHYLFQYWALIQ